MASKTKLKEPKKTTIYSKKLSMDQLETLGELLHSKGWNHYEVAYSLFAYKGDKVNVVGYKSGKLVVQGKNTETFVQDIIEAQITLAPELGYDEILHPSWFEDHAGMDESGKGDVFGPLVVCTVIAEGSMIREWIDQGIRDSKNVNSDRKIKNLAKIISSTKGVVYKTGYAHMPKYNQFYEKIGNLNRMLAWFHAKALEDAYNRKKVPWALLDQFSKQPLVQRQFNAPGFNLRMQTKAESDPVVAAASILARAVYVEQMDRLSEKCGLELSKGASKKVREQIAEIISKHGPRSLGDYAKLHFKPCKEALGIPLDG